MKPNRRKRSTAISAPSHAYQIERIERACASHFGVKVELIHSRNRRAPVAKARQIAMFLAAELTSLTRPEIAFYFGREKSTVDFARRRVSGFLDVYPIVKRDLDRVIAKIQEEALK